MAKQYIKLSDEEKFDFTLIGIACHHKDYMLCSHLNKKLEINLSKQEEYSVFNNKRMEDQLFSFYEYYNEEGDRINLIANKGVKGLLIPEQSQIDYLLILKLIRQRMDEKELLQSLKDIKIILGAYLLDAFKLKSRENLVF